MVRVGEVCIVGREGMEYMEKSTLVDAQRPGTWLGQRWMCQLKRSDVNSIDSFDRYYRRMGQCHSIINNSQNLHGICAQRSSLPKLAISQPERQFVICIYASIRPAWPWRPLYLNDENNQNAVSKDDRSKSTECMNAKSWVHHSEPKIRFRVQLAKC